jgi:glycerol-3-phosphate O-acyltransferase/dihydroxyacetone phosphate acyltransferase
VFYAFVRAVVGFALRLFYRVEVQRRADEPTGPVMYVANHPNAIIDAALVFVITRRHVTFLAREPLFRRPLMGWILRGMGALPVFRRQDQANEKQMAANEGTLESAAKALIGGGAITIFPEGVSHSEPHLAELRTGAARIAFRAARAGAPLRIVPVGLTYADKTRFRSQVRLEIGAALEVAPFLPATADGEHEAVRALTAAISDGLRAVTLDLERWEDLPLIETAERLYALNLGDTPSDPARLRRFAKGLRLFRAEQPERFARLRDELMAFRARLLLVHASPEQLRLQYRPGQLAAFTLRNLAVMLIALPLFVLGMALFAVPFLIPRWAARLVKVDLYRKATLKFLLALGLTPLVYAGLFYLGYRWAGLGTGVLVCALGLPLALFTRVCLERWARIRRDVQVFFTLGNRSRLKTTLVDEGGRISAEVEAVALEIGPRVGMPPREPLSDEVIG